MAGRRLSVLRIERDNLVDRLVHTKDSDKAKILVQIMDLDDDIARIAKEEKEDKRNIRNIH